MISTYKSIEGKNMLKSYFAHILFSALALSFFVACGGPSRTQIGAEGTLDEGGEQAAAECTVETDCAQGQTCDRGICVTQSALCQDDNDCELGLFCELDSGSCVSCLTDVHCDLNELCLEGSCEQAPEDEVDDTGGPGDAVNGCESDADCSYGRCDPATQACVDCLSDNDCPAGYLCSATICTADPNSSGPGGDPDALDDLLGGGSGPTACTTQADCDASCTVCNPSTNVCDACSASLACANGLECLDPSQSIGLPLPPVCVADSSDFAAAASCLGGSLGGGGIPGF